MPFSNNLRKALKTFFSDCPTLSAISASVNPSSELSSVEIIRFSSFPTVTLPHQTYEFGLALWFMIYKSTVFYKFPFLTFLQTYKIGTSMCRLAFSPIIALYHSVCILQDRICLRKHKIFAEKKLRRLSVAKKMRRAWFILQSVVLPG